MRTRLRLVAPLLALVAAGPVIAQAPAGAQAPVGASDNVFTDVSAAVPTPHTVWAKPWAGGPLRVLLLAPAWSQRETAELVQRFAIEALPVMTRTHSVFSDGDRYLAPDKVAERLDRALAARPDVVVIGGFDWGKLLLEHRAGILQAVYGGAGLVYVAPPRNDELRQLFGERPGDPVGVAETLAAGVPLGWLTAFQGRAPDDIVRAGVFGEGRWVVLDYPTHSTNQSLTPRVVPVAAAWEYDQYLSLVGKAIGWAAERPVAAADTEQVLQRPRAALPGKLVLETDAAQVAAVLQRLPDGERTPLAVDGRSVGLPKLAAGRYVVNYRLLDADGAAVGWGAVPLEVSAAAGLAELALDVDALDAPATVSGRVHATRPVAAGERLVAELWDNHGRLVGRRTADTGAELAFSFADVRPLHTNVHRVVAALVDADGPVDQRSAEVSIRGRATPTFHVATWEEPETDHLSSLWYKRFRDQGIDAIFYRADRGQRDAAARLIAEADLFSAPSYPSHHGKTEPGPLGPQHVNGLFDREHRQAAKDKALAATAPFARYDILFHPSGSDVRMGGPCFRPDTLAAFRSWIMDRYGSLAALNQAWGTDFAAWDALVPATLEQAKESGRFASWVEHTRFMEEAFAEHQRMLRNTLRTLDPDALVGEDGYGRLDSYDGADWWRLLGVFGFYNLYTYQDPPQMEITRSLQRAFPEVELRSLYWGSYDGQHGNSAFLRLLPWRALLHDYNGVFWWVANGKSTYPGTENAMLGPDFRPTRSWLDSKAGIDAIRSGIGELVLGAERQHDGIALLYDQTAVHAATAYTHPTRLVAALQGTQDALEDLGLQYDYLSADQVAAGELLGYRVLILPHTLATSDLAAEGVRDFIARGGTVLSDVPPLTHDALLRPAAGGSLLGEAAAQVQPLGFDPAAYRAGRFAAEGAAARQALWPRLTAAGVAPAVALLDQGAEDGDPLGAPGLELVRYRREGVELLGLLNHSGVRTVRLARPQAALVRELISGADVGTVDDWQVDLAPGDARIYVALAEPGAPPSAETVAVTAGDRAIVPVSAPLPGVVRVEVSDPAGARRPLYDRVLTGGAPFELPTALNDPPGEWRLRLVDVARAKVGQATVRVAAP